MYKTIVLCATCCEGIKITAMLIGMCIPLAFHLYVAKHSQ